jgi:hypothetical protein
MGYEIRGQLCIRTVVSQTIISTIGCLIVGFSMTQELAAHKLLSTIRVQAKFEQERLHDLGVNCPRIDI